MLRFAAGLYCHLFRMEIALVLHHASTWAAVSGVAVDVNSLADKSHSAGSLHYWDLAVDLDTAGDRAAHLAQLHGYLARVLAPSYDVVLEATHVHVEWDAHRKPARVDPIYRGDAAPASDAT
jgi:hypothetical protein